MLKTSPRIVASIAGALLALVLTVVRWTQCTTVLAPADLRFDPIHAMTWDAGTRHLTRSGIDPYGYVALPAGAVPLREVVVECSSPPPTDTWAFEIYEYPYNLAGLSISEDRTAKGVIEPSASGGYRIRFTLHDSKLLRFDLPDNLAAPMTIERVVLRSSFASVQSGAFCSLLVVLAVLAALWLVPPAIALMRRRPQTEAVFALLLAAVQIALACDVQLQFQGIALHDDALFVQLADALMHGQWLGPFTPLTLSKGPVYPLFLAAVGWTGIPLQLAQTSLYAFACLVFVFALRRWLPSRALRFALLAVLLFQANALSGAALGRVLRSGIQPALTLLTLAGAIGVLSACTASLRRLATWTAFLAVMATAFWFSREEGVWLVPSLALLLAMAAGVIVAERPSHRIARLTLLLLPLAACWSGEFALRQLNEHYYGAPLALDVSDGYFTRAYGALVRIKPPQPIAGVPVPRAARERAYAVSPAFAQLRPFLEGDIGRMWSGFGWDDLTDPRARTDIRGGWFQWALRDAAAAAGYYRDAATADLFWRVVANDLNRAADDGRLPAGPWRKGFFPRWEPEYTRRLPGTLFAAYLRAATASDFDPQPRLSNGDPAMLERFVRITHEPGLRAPRPAGWRTVIREFIQSLQQRLAVPFTAAAALATLWLAVRAGRRSFPFAPVAILLALWMASGALLGIVALVHVTSFSALFAIYLSAATPLLMAATVLTFAWSLSSHVQLPPLQSSPPRRECS